LDISIVFSFTLPGFGFILFSSDLFYKLDIQRIIFLSIFYSIPFFVFGIITANHIDPYLPRDKEVKDKTFNYFSLSSLLAVLIFYAAIGMHLIIKKISPGIFTENLNPALKFGLYTLLISISTYLILYFKRKN
jgi:O-antigen/teichoic acid export membrane protein